MSIFGAPTMIMSLSIATDVPNPGAVSLGNNF